MKFNEINDKTPEGRLLIAAISVLNISPEIRMLGEALNGQKMTPDEIFDRLKTDADDIYIDQPIDPFNAAADPLIKYMAEQHHPHCTAIVTNTNAQVFEGVKSTGHVVDYLND